MFSIFMQKKIIDKKHSRDSFAITNNNTTTIN